MEGFDNFINRLQNNEYDMVEEDKKYKKALEDKKKKKQHPFAKFGFDHVLMKSIYRIGFNVPTPIQERSIPHILKGRDVIGMARTGSGKTASYLFPLFEKLGYKHSSVVGARALIIVPTRELVMQVNKVIYDFVGKSTDLRTCMLTGGKALEGQFERLTMNPDIIIATPGRLIHIIEETGLSLSKVEYVVIDEADRLFEMSLSEQLYQIIAKLPLNRQTLLFSATLPSAVAEFSKAGLNQPELIRLDSDVKISENLKISHLFVRSNEKFAALIYLLTNVIDERDLTIVFLPTRHHAEYLIDLFEHYNIRTTVIYGSMDQQARSENLEKFRKHEVRTLLVTDVAARGIDVPNVNNVINLNFPAKPKLFIHRVGRAARAGRTGTAFSIVSPDEIPYVLDLELFLGRKTKNTPEAIIKEDENGEIISKEERTLEGNWKDFIDGYYGTIPQHILDREIEQITHFEKVDSILISERDVCTRAMELYNRTRSDASGASIERSKALKYVAIHPMLKLKEKISNDVEKQLDFVSQIKAYKPPETIFETKEKVGTREQIVMENRRKVLRQAQILKEVRDGISSGSGVDDGTTGTTPTTEEKEPKSLAERLLLAKLMNERYLKLSTITTPKPKKSFKNPEFYMSYEKEGVDPSDNFYSVNEKKNRNDDSNMPQGIQDAVMDLVGEDRQEINKFNKKGGLVWDRKKKKYVQRTDDKNKNAAKDAKDLKQQNKYGKWKKKTHGRIQRVGETEEDQGFSTKRKRGEVFKEDNYDDSLEGDEVTLTTGQKRKKLPWEIKKDKAKDTKFVKEGKGGKDEVKTQEQLRKERKERRRQAEHRKVSDLMKRVGKEKVLGAIAKKGLTKALTARNALPKGNSKMKIRVFKRRGK
ncbi:hypothetical protein ABK040_014376 [Willaertia magna]